MRYLLLILLLSSTPVASQNCSTAQYLAGNFDGRIVLSTPSDVVFVLSYTVPARDWVGESGYAVVGPYGVGPDLVVKLSATPCDFAPPTGGNTSPQRYSITAPVAGMPQFPVGSTFYLNAWSPPSNCNELGCRAFFENYPPAVAQKPPVCPPNCPPIECPPKCDPPPTVHPLDVVEYKLTSGERYFLTPYPDEQKSLDAGKSWKRTGTVLRFWTTASAATGYGPTCRLFYSDLTAHFFTSAKPECTSLAEANPTGKPNAWQLETTNTWVVLLPVNGACASPTLPVRRYYNGTKGIGPAHRYGTAMAGWIDEGVVMCQRSATASKSKGKGKK